MRQVVEAPPRLSRKGKRWGQVYPWGRWFARGGFRALRGRDYSCRTDTFIQQVRTFARFKGVGVTITVSDDSTRVGARFRPKEGRGRKRA